MGGVLTRTEAATRAGLLGVDGYAVDLDLTTGADVFGPTTTVGSRCARPGTATFVELRPAELHPATLNGRPLDPGSLAEGRLALPDLAADNELVVRATMAYSNSCEGLHRFVDPADGEAYVYGQSFLDNAQNVFACFDQPDLKAPVVLAVPPSPQLPALANGAGEFDAPGPGGVVPRPPEATD